MKPESQKFKLRQRNTGFTLLEALIALVVLSIGLLGIAALQGAGLRSNHSAYLASQAALLAYDMADRIRANPAGNYAGFASGPTTCVGGPPGSTDLDAADKWEWGCDLVGQLLPNGEGTIEGVPVVGPPPATRYTITISWEDRTLAAGAEPWEFVLVVEI